MNTFNLKLDVDKSAKGLRNQVVRIRKGDLNGTVLVATLYDHGTKITTSGLTVDFVMLQPDREHYYRATATWSAANGTASVTLDESYAGSIAGDTDLAYFEIRQGTQVIASTENFRVSVLRSATDEGEEPAESYDDIIPAAVYAWLEDHPEATTTVQDNSLTTAKYQDGSVTAPKLAANAVTTPKLADNAVTKPKLSAALRNALGNVLRGEATGAVAQAHGTYAAPPLGLTVDGKSVQDGTPTPSAPVAIDSVESVTLNTAGFNHWNELWENGRIDTTTGANVSAPSQIRTKGMFSVAPSTRYYLYCGTSNANVWCGFFDATGAIIPTPDVGTTVSIANNFVALPNMAFTTPSNAAYMRFYLVATYGSTYNNDICLNLYDVARNGTYEPYVGTTTAIDLQGHELRSLPDGTHDELVVDADGNMTLVQRVGVYEITASTPFGGGATLGSYTRVSINVAANTSSPYAATRMTVEEIEASEYCTHAPIDGDYAEESTHVYIAQSANGTTNLQLFGLGNADAVKTMYTGAKVYYKLLNTQVIPLGTVTLPALAAPYATAWAVTDPSTTIALDYERDVNMAIEEMGANIAPVEQAVATANHATGSLMMLGGHLVKATTSIAIGEAVAIGTNVSATTVAAELALKANA